MKMRPTERTVRPIVNAMMSTIATESPVSSTSHTYIHSFIHSFHSFILFYKRHDRTQANIQNSVTHGVKKHYITKVLVAVFI